MFFSFLLECFSSLVSFWLKPSNHGAGDAASVVPPIFFSVAEDWRRLWAAEDLARRGQLHIMPLYHIAVIVSGLGEDRSLDRPGCGVVHFSWLITRFGITSTIKPQLQIPVTDLLKVTLALVINRPNRPTAYPPEINKETLRILYTSDYAYDTLTDQILHNRHSIAALNLKPHPIVNNNRVEMH